MDVTMARTRSIFAIFNLVETVPGASIQQIMAMPHNVDKLLAPKKGSLATNTSSSLGRDSMPA